MYTNTHTSIFIRMYTAPTYEPPCINAYIHHRIHTHACVSRYIYIYIYIYIYPKGYIYICTHTHTHTHMRV